MIKQLKTELASGNYDAMSDEDVANSLNTKDIALAKEYMLTDVRLANLIGTVKAVTCIEAFKTQGDPISLWVVDKLMSTGLDIGNVEAPAFINPLVLAGVITQEDAYLVLDLGQEVISRATEIGINGTVMGYHVAEARS